MVNFKPMKKYVMDNLDKAIKKHNIKPPFLDFGGGTGDVSVHLAKKHWKGNYIDISNISTKIAKQRLSFTNLIDFNDYKKQEYNSIFLFDVIEHVKKDKELLKEINKNLKKEGHLVLLVPMYMSEWNKDDVFYGHYRRYSLSELKQLLNETGYKFVEFYNISFPFLWVARKLYLRFLFKPPTKSEKEELTKESSYKNPWKSEFLNKNNFVWNFLFSIQNLFTKNKKGFEFLIIAKK